MKTLFRLGKKYHGMGKVHVAWQTEGNFLATAGKNGMVHITDRSGEPVDEIPLATKERILNLEWSPDGEYLAALQFSNSVLILWCVSSRKTLLVETNVKDPSFLKWSKTGDQLVIGTGNGNILMYNPVTRKLVPILGKHPKEISCGDWTSSGILALGSVDGAVTFSEKAGTTINQVPIGIQPNAMHFGLHNSINQPRSRNTKRDENVLLIQGKNSVVLIDMSKKEDVSELTFLEKYGTIIDAAWIGEGSFIMAFSEGYLVSASSNAEELGEEKLSAQFFNERIISMTVCRDLNRVAICGNGGIKIINVGDFTVVEDDCVKLADAEENEAYMMRYSPDAQIMVAGTFGGIAQTFLSRMPTHFDFEDTYVARLSSLREVSIVDINDRDHLILVQVQIEPNFIALGPYHVAVGMNNHVWYYRVDGKNNALVHEQEYLGTVTSVQLNAKYAAVLCEGKISLHGIEPEKNSNTKMFPHHASEGKKGGPVRTVAMTKEFMIYGTEGGTVEYFFLKDWIMLDGSTCRHDEGIIQLFPNRDGTRTVFLDARRQAFLFNPVSKSAIPIVGLPSSVKSILWDDACPNLLCAIDTNAFHTILVIPSTISGEQVCVLGDVAVENNGDVVISPACTPIPAGQSAILFHDGKLLAQDISGSLTDIIACTHARLEITRVTVEKQRASFCQNLALLRFVDAWKLVVSLDIRSYWLALASKAMEVMDVDMAKRVYQHLSDAGMVVALERLQQVEDKNLLAGEIFVLFGDYARAQELLLLSSSPIAALDMRRNLLHWDQALKLASTLAPLEIPQLSASYAQQLEFMGDHEASLRMYEQAIAALKMQKAKSHPLQPICVAGVARSTLRLGDLRRGTQLVLDVNDTTLCKECGSILEGIKQYSDAAVLYEAGKHYDKAASLYIQVKNVAKVAPLMQYVTAPKIHGQFARMKEASKDFEAAVASYERAQDLDSVVRIHLTHLNHPERAFDIVRKSKSAEGALSVAQHCMDTGNYRGAIEFLLMANKSQDAFDLAHQHNEMETFAEILGDGITIEQALNVAHYFEGVQKTGKAGMFYQIAGNFNKALKFYLLCGEREMDRAVEVVGKAKNDMLTHTLIDFLMGETDGVPKDPNYIFRLYMALGNFNQAAKTAIIIARQEQDAGNYKISHGILYEISSKLKENGERVPQSLARNLMLLHTYILAKSFVKQKDHHSAALLLIRVSNNISKFPNNVVDFLTLTVIECQRSNFKKTALEIARKLVFNAEHKLKIQDAYKKKIDAMVRRPTKEQDIELESSPCPHCNNDVPNTELDCVHCKNWIAYCIITGTHMTRNDWSECPHCHFPAKYSALLNFINVETRCPMCEEEIIPFQVQRVSEKDIQLDPYSKPNQENQTEEETP